MKAFVCCFSHFVYTYRTGLSTWAIGVTGSTPAPVRHVYFLFLLFYCYYMTNKYDDDDDDDDD